MIRANPESARMLNQHSRKISAAACKHLFATMPELITNQNAGTHLVWDQHFSQRVNELSTAIATGEPELFTSRVSWSGEAMLARGQDKTLISNTLQSLKYAVIEVLHANLGNEIIGVIDTTNQELIKNTLEQTKPILDPKKTTDRIALRYLEAALEGDSRKAMDLVLGELQKSSDPKAVILEILMPAQREVGRLWHLAGITIAEEHQVTATTQRCMALISEKSVHAPANGYTAVCASIAGNVHEIGIRAIAYFLEMEGWKTIYLGADVPPDELPSTAEFYDADIMLLSLAISSQLPGLQTAITTTRQHQPDLKILVGGSAFAETTGLWRKIGADGYARDGEQALVLAKELVSPL